MTLHGQAMPFALSFNSVSRTWSRHIALVIALLIAAVSAASAETLLMPPRDMLVGSAATPNGPGATGEVVWGVTTLPNNTAGSPTTYTINFGDGSLNATGPVTDRSFIAVNHIFAATGVLTVTLQVTNGSTTELATTTVRVFDGLLISDEQRRGVNVNRAIENGLRYLWVGQNGRAANFPNSIYTDWASYDTPHAAFVVLAFENHGYHLSNDDVPPTGLYEKYIVRRGLNFIINNLNQRTLTAQNAGDPCVNVADAPAPCVGLGSNQYQEGYATSIAILPLAASNALSRTVTEIPGSASAGYVVGKTYGEVLQRLVNTMAFGQGDGPTLNFGRGGWTYSFNGGSTDGSTIGWNVLALLDSEAAGITVPAFVKSEFINYAIPYGLNNDGTFDYTSGNNATISQGTATANMAKNGIGVQAMFYAGMVGLGDTDTTFAGFTDGQRVLNGRNSINSRWNAPLAGDGWLCATGSNKGCAYAMFNVFKALKLQGITTLPNVARPQGPGNIPAGDWYADYVDWLLANQTDPTGLASLSGSWSGGTGKTAMSFSGSDNSSNAANAAMAELILSPVALISPDPSLFSTVGLSPSTALRTPFGTHTVTATATSAGGAPVAGATVNFEVLTGLNAGKPGSTGSAVTDQNGTAQFTYTDGFGPGRDTIQAFIGSLGSNVVEVIWSIPDCSPTQTSAVLNSPIFPIDQGWRGVTINGAAGAKVTQVCQDEPPNFENIAAWAIDADGVGTSAASIRAQRSGTRTNPGNGRVYTIYFTAAACKGSVTVNVPLVSGGNAVNDGARYNSVTGAACTPPPVPAVTSVPNVVGQTQANAASTLGASGLTLGAVSQVNSQSVPYGQVMSQLPQAGANVAAGSAVAVTVSSGPSSVVVPNVVNLPQASATAAVTGANLNPSITTVYSDSIAAGLVMSQNIPGGTLVPPGSSLLLIVSLGKQTSIVPNVVGLPLAGAVSTVGGAGLNFGNVNLVFSNTVTDGIVISQSPAPGTVVAPGSLVDFDISQGPQPVPVPNLAGMDQSQASAAIVAANLTVGNVTTAHDPTVPAGQVAQQVPAAGSLAKPGSEVVIVMSLGPKMVDVPLVANQPLAAAQTAIVGVGLVVGTVTPMNHPAVAPGAIIGSTPPEGASVPLGSSVNLTVSLGPTPVVVPNLLGQSQAGAQVTLIGANLTLGSVTTASSPSVPVGNVMGQNPLAGSTVLPSTAVNIVVSTGPVIVTVPNVVGLTQASAQTAIAGANLFLQSITFITNAAPAGQVIGQTPVAGASAVLGSPMTITVSLGSNSVTVPNVIGQTQANAAATLVGAGLTVGTVTQTAHPNVPAGKVIDQSPAGSTVAPQGAGVNLLVSTGPVSATVPNVLGHAEATAIAEILAAHLGAIVTYGTDPVVTAGNVISQNPGSGTTVAEGSNVTIKVSTGLVAATVPNVVGQTEAAATTSLIGAGLVKGTVTQQSSAQPVGVVISQTPSAGASAAGGTSVNLVLSLGPQPGVPAFLNLSLSSQVLAAGASSSITSSVLDGFSVPIIPTPGLTLQIVPGPGATGTAPYVSGVQIFTSADTRGAYTLHGTVDGTVVAAGVAFSVFDGNATSTNAAKFIKLGGAEQTVKDKIDALLQAYQNLAPASDVTAARNAMTAALSTVPIAGPLAMQRSTAVALEHGFLPSLSLLQANGLPVTAQDNAFGNLIGQIGDKLDEIRAFYQALNPDATVGAANSVQQLNTLNAELEALKTQLGAINPTPAGIVKFAPQLNRLLGETIPLHLHAVTNRAISVAQQYPDPANLPGGVARLQGAEQFFAEINARREVLTPGSFYQQTQPAFFGLLGLMSGCSLQMKLVNEIYGPIMTEVSEMIAVLALNGLIETYGNTAAIGDLVSGASLSFHAPGLGGSQIEGYGFDTTSPSGNETWFIGPEAFDLVSNLIKSFKPEEMDSIQKVWDYFKGIADAVNATFEGYERAHTQADDLYQGGCILDDSFGCTALIFNSGFPDVNSTRFPSPVIVILNNKNNGSWSSGIFNFVP